MIFVTGGTGLLGRHLLVELARNEVQINAIYRDSSKIEEVKKCFEFYLGESAGISFQRINWIQCDMLNISELDEHMRGCDELYHCAGMVSFHKRDFSKMMEINRYGTANVVNCALKNTISKCCFVSSIAAIGNKDIAETTLVDEEGKWLLTDTTTGYGISKFSAEKEVWRGINEGLNAVIVNPGVIFGAGKFSESSLAIFEYIRKHPSGFPIGATAYVDARDTAQIMVELMTQNSFNERYICVGENASYQQLFRIIAKKMGKELPQRPISPKKLMVVYRLLSILSTIAFSRSKLTKEIAQTSSETIMYSNKKVVEKTGHKFYSLEEMVTNVLEYQSKIN